jgi:ATP-dependent helicase/nuclease subunit A
LYSGENTIADWQLRNCGRPLEWVLLGLSDQKILHDVFQTGLSDKAKNDNLFSFKLYDQVQLQKLSEFIIRQKTEKMKQGSFASKKSLSEEESGLIEQIKKSIYRKYQYGDSHLIPAKTSVTELTHRNDEYIKFNYSSSLSRQPSILSDMKNGKIPESRLIGTASHLVISQIDLSEPVASQTIELVKEQLIEGKKITETIASHINSEAIAGFFDSKPGMLVLDKKNKVLREWPFTFAERKMNDDFIIVQGIIDMLIQTPDCLVIVDFKTDKVTQKQVNQRTELYRGQLEMYSRAAQSIIKAKTISKWLYFLNPQIAVEV